MSTDLAARPVLIVGGTDPARRALALRLSALGLRRDPAGPPLLQEELGSLHDHLAAADTPEAVATLRAEILYRLDLRARSGDGTPVAARGLAFALPHWVALAGSGDLAPVVLHLGTPADDGAPEVTAIPLPAASIDAAERRGEVLRDTLSGLGLHVPPALDTGQDG